MALFAAFQRLKGFPLSLDLSEEVIDYHHASEYPFSLELPEGISIWDPSMTGSTKIFVKRLHKEDPFYLLFQMIVIRNWMIKKACPPSLKTKIMSLSSEDFDRIVIGYSDQWTILGGYGGTLKSLTQFIWNKFVSEHFHET